MFAQVSNAREMIVTVAASLFATYLFVGSAVSVAPIA